jgi:hypothetical protein
MFGQCTEVTQMVIYTIDNSFRYNLKTYKEWYD